MKLDKNINYLVSGLERSGTSMLMQILHAADLPVGFDNTRVSDENNPKGYFELEGGKIISKLMKNDFPLDKFKGQIIKITSFGLKFLPQGKYKIIYSERNIDEIMKSMDKMIGKPDPNPEETKNTFLKLNNMIKNMMQDRSDVDIVYVNYNRIISNPNEDIKKICKFLQIPDEKIDDMIKAVDNKLYRNRKK